MKKLLNVSLAALMLLLLACADMGGTSKYTKAQLVGQWTKTMMYDEMVLNEDGTGQKGNTAILGLKPIKWELDGDSLRIIGQSGIETFFIDSIPEADYQGYHVYGLFLSKTDSDGTMRQHTWVRKEKQ